MASLVFALSAVRAADTAMAGGKGARLGELMAHGFPVPPGFVVSADAYREFADALTLSASFAAIAAASSRDLASLCAALRTRIVGAEIPAPLAAEIVEAHRHMTDGDAGLLCAVRSSATAEDQASASFAGQHGTYYYVDAAHLLEMVRRCWASLWTPEAVSYRRTHGIAHERVWMAVVVQEMVRADVSGVAFTVNPIAADRDEMVVEASWGLGAALVDGRVTPDHYVVARDGLAIREQRIADKRSMVPPHLPPGSDGRLIEVPQDLRRRETLSAGDVTSVATWALKCEAYFGSPQDVEWAIADGCFHLLQSRPITTLGGPPREPQVAGSYVLFKPIAENFTEPATPLTVDLLMAACQPFLRVIDGRLYQDLDYWRPLVPLDLSDEDLAELLYSMFAVRPTTIRLSFPRLVKAALGGAGAWLVGGVTLMRTRNLPDDCMDMFRDFCREIEEDPSLGPADAIRRLGFTPRLLAPIGRLPVLINVTCIRFAAWLGLLRLMLRRWAPNLPASAPMLLSAGSEGMRSADMGRAIQRLAREARRTVPVSDILLTTPPEAALARLRKEPDARAFLLELDRFLADHGHRAVREFEIRAPRWSENPAPVLAMIRNGLAGGPEDAAQPDKAIAARLATERAVDAALAAQPLERTWGLRSRLVRAAAGRTRYFLKLRENSRFAHIMSIGVIRRKVLQVEGELLRNGRLKCADDIFFLRWSETAALRDGRSTWADVEQRIRERRMTHVRLAKVTPRKTIGIAVTVREDREGPVDQIDGLPASPGCHEGLARVILDPTVDAVLEPGEVLVAPYTDPAWTPLFLTAGAAVVEVGSYLSHAGTVAREFGMPCVVDVPDCTRRIQTGMRVRVDGNRGHVRILSKGAS